MPAVVFGGIDVKNIGYTRCRPSIAVFNGTLLSPELLY